MVLTAPQQAVVLTAEHRVYGRSAAVQSEVQRVEAGGGWVRDGRVCDILGVSRTFGDRDFKGEGLQRLLQYGVRYVCVAWVCWASRFMAVGTHGCVHREGLWDESFAKQQTFTADPVIVDPGALLRMHRRFCLKPSLCV